MQKHTCTIAWTILILCLTGCSAPSATEPTPVQQEQGIPTVSLGTGLSRHETVDGCAFDVEVPQVKPDTDSEFLQDINAEIQALADSYMESAVSEFGQEKAAFFATGGTDADWNDRTMDVTIQYVPHYQSDTVLSFEVTTSRSSVASMEERHYYNLSLADGTKMNLSDATDGKSLDDISAEINRQITERIQTVNAVYFGYDEGGNKDTDSADGFTGVDEDTDFYLDEDGDVVVVFGAYEIAPGSMGVQEFEIGH